MVVRLGGDPGLRPRDPPPHRGRDQRGRAPGGRDADRPRAGHDLPLPALRDGPRPPEERRLRRRQDPDHRRGRELPRRGAGRRPCRVLAPRRERRHDGRERNRLQPRHLHERRHAGTAGSDHGRPQLGGRSRRGRRHGACTQLGRARADGRPFDRGVGGSARRARNLHDRAKGRPVPPAPDAVRERRVPALARLDGHRAHHGAQPGAARALPPRGGNLGRCGDDGLRERHPARDARADRSDRGRHVEPLPRRQRRLRTTG